MSIAKDISDLLDTERAAIKRGAFGGLADIAEAKAVLFTRLAETISDAEMLADLRRQAERNQSLLEAAQRGLGAALTQISTARAAGNPQTYGPGGERDALGPRSTRVEKRC